MPADFSFFKAWFSLGFIHKSYKIKQKKTVVNISYHSFYNKNYNLGRKAGDHLLKTLKNQLSFFIN